jgi:hypothetical protein
VLFHVTGDTTWSNLPLSGLFVDMLRRITALAGAPDDVTAEGRNAENQTVAPRLTLDGYGIFASPPANARAVARTYNERATAEHPPGFYGPGGFEPRGEPARASDRLAPLNFAPLYARIAPLARSADVDLRTPLFTWPCCCFLSTPWRLCARGPPGNSSAAHAPGGGPPPPSPRGRASGWERPHGPPGPGAQASHRVGPPEGAAPPW